MDKGICFEAFSKQRDGALSQLLQHPKGRAGQGMSHGLELQVLLTPKESWNSHSPNAITLAVHLWFPRMNLSPAAPHYKGVKEHFDSFYL